MEPEAPLLPPSPVTLVPAELVLSHILSLLFSSCSYICSIPFFPSLICYRIQYWLLCFISDLERNVSQQKLKFGQLTTILKIFLWILHTSLKKLQNIYRTLYTVWRTVWRNMQKFFKLSQWNINKLECKQQLCLFIITANLFTDFQKE